MRSVPVSQKWLLCLLAFLMIVGCFTSCRANPLVETPTDSLTSEDSEPGTTAPEDTTVEGGGSLENKPYDPNLHPGDPSLYEGVLIHSVYGTGKKGAEALISHGYVQLYNPTDKDISLYGASLYYKTDDANPYEQFLFPEGATIPAGGYYLVRANSPADFVADNAVLGVPYCDAEWDI